MKKLTSAPIALTIHHYRNILMAEGIASEIRNEHFGGILGDMPFTETWPQLWVVNDLDYEPGNKYAEKAFKKFKLKVEPNGATEVSHDMTGKKQDIINYLQSSYYDFDDEDVRDLYPELLEDN